MKKIFQVAVMALVGLAGYNANAQEGALSVKAGINFNGVSGEGTSGLKRNIGFHAGVAYEMQLGEIFYVEPGLFLDTAGFKSSTSEGSIGDYYVKNETKANVYALAIPVHAKVKFPVGDDMAAYFAAGPYMSVGLSGKHKTETTSNLPFEGTKTRTTEEKIKFGSKAGEANRFGFGLSFGAGVSFKQFIIGAGYDLGLTEIAKDSKQKFNAFKITLGYTL